MFSLFLNTQTNKESFFTIGKSAHLYPYNQNDKGGTDSQLFHQFQIKQENKKKNQSKSISDFAYKAILSTADNCSSVML